MIVRENVYGYIKKNKVGRIYSSSRSLQSLKREVRTLLLRDTYVDLDLKSSSFSILLEYAKDHNLEHEVPTLIRYVLSKDSLIDETVQRILHATKYADNEDYIKTTRENVSIILKKEFIRNSNVEIKLKINRMPFFMLQMIRKIQLEVSIIRNHLVKNEMVLQKYKIDYTDKKPVSIQCEYIHTMESKLLEYLIVELEKNGVNHFIPMFDGVAYIPSENPFDIDSFNSRLRKEFNYKYVTFSEKIWEDPKILEGLNLKKLREKYIFHKNTAEILLEEKQKELEEFFTKDFLFTEYKNMDEKLLYMEIFELFEKQKDLYILQNMEELHYILSIDPLSLESIRESLKEGIKSDLDSIPERVRELCDKFRIKSQQ